MTEHYCWVDDGTRRVLCLCATAKDHDEFNFDDPDAEDYAEDERFDM